MCICTYIFLCISTNKHHTRVTLCTGAIAIQLLCFLPPTTNMGETGVLVDVTGIHINGCLIHAQVFLNTPGRYREAVLHTYTTVLVRWHTCIPIAAPLTVVM